MKWVTYRPNTIFAVSESTSPISSKFHIYSKYGGLIGTIDIGDDPDDFVVGNRRKGYEPVVEWVAENWRSFYCRKQGKLDGVLVRSILNVPVLHIKYDEE